MHLWTIDLATAELNAQTTFHLSCPSEVQKKIYPCYFSGADACTSAVITRAISTSAIITSAISTSAIIPSASLPPINIYSLTKLASDKLLTGRGRSLPLPLPRPCVCLCLWEQCRLSQEAMLGKQALPSIASIACAWEEVKAAAKSWKEPRQLLAGGCKRGGRENLYLIIQFNVLLSMH